MYTSSLACPYNCGYCTNDGVYGRKWNALEPEQVVEETTDLVSALQPGTALDRRRQFPGRSRPRASASPKAWCAAASSSTGAFRRPPTWSIRLTVDELKLLRRSGLTQISQGADTGSHEVMHLMNKDFQDLDDIYEAADKLTAGRASGLAST